MAKLHYVPSFIGTQHGITIYFMNGQFYMRSASTLTRKKVLTDPAFAKTRAENTIHGNASKIASRIYQYVPQKNKKRELFNQIVARVKRLLKAGIQEKEIIETISNFN